MRPAIFLSLARSPLGLDHNTTLRPTTKYTRKPNVRAETALRLLSASARLRSAFALNRNHGYAGPSCGGRSPGSPAIVATPPHTQRNMGIWLTVRHSSSQEGSAAEDVPGGLSGRPKYAPPTPLAEPHTDLTTALGSWADEMEDMPLGSESSLCIRHNFKC
jgi:hypothetical protein